MDILVGTAGHIDHGKTSLVRRLTGIDTDRLPAEKARGISIDLGFAHYEFQGMRFGIVDVPGHERFVRNMVAGATGINVALLVVAADDGVMPQTREHLDIMQLLGIREGLIAVTKSDLVEPDLLELVQTDISSAVAGTFLTGRPIVPVSSTTGAGLDELKQRLFEVCCSAIFDQPLPLYRLPIDRAFSLAGHGTVVTGSTLSGIVAAGDVLELWPEGREVRVRSVQQHGHATSSARPGQRTAINLAGIKLDEVRRGCELATPGYLRPTRRLLVELKALDRTPSGIKHRSEVMLHLGTTEVAARVSLRGGTLESGQQSCADLRLREPVVATWGQRFIVRRVSPAMTLGGGRILCPSLEDAATHRIRDLDELCGRLGDPSPLVRLSAYLSRQDDLQGIELAVAQATGIAPQDLPRLMNELRAKQELVRVDSRERQIELHTERLQRLLKTVLRTIRNEVARHQPRRSLPKPTLLTACQTIAKSSLLEVLIDQLVAQKDLVQIGEQIGPTDMQVRLTKQQRRLYDAAWQQLSTGKLMPPTLKELAQSTARQPDDVEQMLNLMVEEQLIIRATDEIAFTRSALEAARIKCRDLFSQIESASMGQLRDAWAVTRKFAVPLCECLDALEVTVREGDFRQSGPNLSVPLIE